jgi:hypothetical protein
LVDEELLLFARSSGNVRTYGVIGGGVFVPEPATLAMLCICAVGMLWKRSC